MSRSPHTQRPDDSAPQLHCPQARPVTDWIVGHSHSLVDGDDPLASLIADAQIVGLGEMTHGSHEVFEMKSKLVKWLIEERGFRVFAIEGCAVRARAIDDYIKSGQGNAAQALVGMGFWTWSTEELRDLVEWMRQFNRSLPEGNTPVSFVGFDAQIIEHGRNELIRSLPPTLRPLAESIPTDVQLREDLGKNWNSSLSDNERDEARRRFLDAISNAQSTIRKLGEEIQSEGVDDPSIHDGLKFVRQMIDGYAALESGNFNQRDVHMADNVIELSERFPQQKILLWAHNLHLAKLPGTRAWSSQHFRPMGLHLAQKFGASYRSLAISFTAGTFTCLINKSAPVIGTLHQPRPDTFEYWLAEVSKNLPPGPFVVDFNRGEEAPWDDSMGMCLLGASSPELSYEQSFGPCPPHTNFDGVICVNESTPTRILHEYFC